MDSSRVSVFVLSEARFEALTNSTLSVLMPAYNHEGLNHERNLDED